ncbi:helix-hairpin-helix domain-containing protein [Halorussus caseinilyticus]|uniref:Helix-hairpin-helix domain-containing protein n=1 Tax=Halorussus caseinilyticus TaxID=3034025 RepID=A0ABD5WIU4_9EURY|nr:helix-hairpin-helix domain-containing protein [Halorussus sp. DT72]
MSRKQTGDALVSQNDASDDESPDGVAELTDIHFVGPATAEVLADADFDATGIADKSVSYEMLIDAGVNPGVATRLRKIHSLHWSFGGSDEDDDSLEQRSEKIRGLQDDEREWVAASSGDWESSEPETTQTTSGDWTPTGEATADGSGAAEEAEAAWRERSKPDPVTDVPGVDEEIAEILANGGVTSVRSLATADPEHVADSLGLDTERVSQWRDDARDLA